MIVVLRDQLEDHGATDPARAAAAKRAQAGVRADLGQLQARGIRSLVTADAVAARLTTAEASWLRQDPAVAAVVPDRRLHVATNGLEPVAARGSRATTPAPAADATCPSDPVHPLIGQDLTLTHTMAPNGSTRPRRAGPGNRPWRQGRAPRGR